MSDEKEHQDKHQLRNGVIAVAAGLLSGITAATNTLRDRFYSELKNWPRFKELFEAHERDLYEANEAHQNVPFSKMADDIGPIKDSFAEKIENKLLAEHGIHTRGWKGYTEGTLQRLELSGARTKNRVIFNTVLSTAVAMGGTLMFFNSLATRRHIEHIADTVDAQAEKSR